MSAHSKLLSIVIVGRNDDYLGNYRYRLETCLDFLARNLRTLGRLNDVEVLFLDWNSPDKPISDVLQVSADAASILRIVVVPPEVAAARNLTVSFFTTCAVNAGVRRSKGEFIMLADSDSMMPLPALKSLLEVLEGKLPTFGPKDELIYPLPRYQIPGGIGARQPNVAAWEKILQRLMASRRKELPAGDCLGGFSAAQLMHRKLWWEFGGYSEVLDRAWGWSDNDLMLRVTQKYNWMDLGYYGVVAFHIEHHASTGNAHARDPNSINKMLVDYNPHPNAEDWGLGSITLPEHTLKGARAVSSTPEWKPLACRTTTDLGPAMNSEFCEFVSRVAHGRGREPGMAGNIGDDAVTAGAVLTQQEHARNAFYFGSLRWPLLSMIVDGNPGIDLFLINPWAEGEITDPSGDPGMLSMLLANSSYRGFARIVSGPVTEALASIERSDPLAMPIEFAIVRRTDIEADFSRVMPQILSRLAPGGAVLLIDEKKRAPRDPAAMRTFLGRLLRNGDGGEKTRVFTQNVSEDALGEAFHTLSMATGAVHLIRARSGIKAQPARIAAE